VRHVFWLAPGVLAGRPGPDREPWSLAELAQSGFGAVLSVNDGVLCHPGDFARSGIEYRCLPLSPNAPPQSGDVEHCRRVLPEAFEFVMHMAKSGKATLVHCSSGKDRTGLFMAYYLVRSGGVFAEEAVKIVKQARPIAFSAVGWEQFAQEVLS
jgi:protein-tyrosine phosphatase